MSDYNSQHAIALHLKAMGAFDYEFTTVESDNSNFSVCFSDWVRSKEYKGKTFNSIRYNGDKFVTDKIELKSEASSMKVFSAKAGSVLILEYFKKGSWLPSYSFFAFNFYVNYLSYSYSSYNGVIYKSDPQDIVENTILGLRVRSLVIVALQCVLKIVMVYRGSRSKRQIM